MGEDLGQVMNDTIGQAAKCSADGLRLAYLDLMESRLLYGDIFWGFRRPHLLNRIFRLQKRVLRFKSSLRFAYER